MLKYACKYLILKNSGGGLDILQHYTIDTSSTKKDAIKQLKNELQYFYIIKDKKTKKQYYILFMYVLNRINKKIIYKSIYKIK